MEQSKLYLIAPNYAEAGALETLPQTSGLHILKNDNLVQSELRFNTHDKVCITSEASIELVKNRLIDSSKQKAIDTLKDKYRFREVLTSIYPNYQFKSVALDEISKLEVHSNAILKPAKGCFGTAVKLLTPETNLQTIVQEIDEELQKNASVLSSEVLSSNQFILEDYIEGEEYAVDMFYDANGKPHIVNVYHHPMPKHEAYLHMIYYSSKAVFERIYDKAMDFFTALNAILQVKNFTMHSEFRYDGQRLIPIEINCMRFGGMGLGNMVYHTMGVNPYQCFNTGSSPNWDQLWNHPEHAQNVYAFFIAYNGTNVDTQKQQPDIDKLKAQFTQVVQEELFDYQKQLAFGVFSLKETTDSLQRLLQIDFNNYFKPI